MWPFNKEKTAFNSWPIVRTRPNGKKYGRAIQLFINNMQCHLTTVNVYSDGAVDCWGFVDLDLFKQKLRARWVVPGAVKSDQRISVFHFGATGFCNAVWMQTPTSIFDEVESIVRKLNPEMIDLVDMQGCGTEARGRVRYPKMGLSDKKPFRNEENSRREILGDSVSILRVLPEAFELTNLFLFSDGLMQIGSDGRVQPLDQIKSLYEQRAVANSAPPGSKIIIPGLGSFETTTSFGGVSENDRVLELHDKLAELQGKPSVVKLCAQAFSEYQISPTPENKETLRGSYERVPEHLRCYCGDMDTKDTAIRRVLYGDGKF